MQPCEQSERIEKIEDGIVDIRVQIKEIHQAILGISPEDGIAYQVKKTNGRVTALEGKNIREEGFITGVKVMWAALAAVIIGAGGLWVESRINNAFASESFRNAVVDVVESTNFDFNKDNSNSAQ
jgi:hypothetical protein